MGPGCTSRIAATARSCCCSHWVSRSFWWTWREQLPRCPAACYARSPPTCAATGAVTSRPGAMTWSRGLVRGPCLVRSLGEPTAVVVGPDWGAAGTPGPWPTYYPKVVRQGWPSSRWRTPLRWGPRWSPIRWARAAQRVLLRLPGSVPPERSLVAGRTPAGRVRSCRSWSCPAWPDPETERRSGTAMCIPSVAHSPGVPPLVRPFRVRPDGLRYSSDARLLSRPPTLHMQGALDTCVLPATARGSGRHSTARTAGACSPGPATSRIESSRLRFDRELLRGYACRPQPGR